VVHSPLIVAHRGACGYRPEHTAAAILLAIEMKVDAIEIDVVPTSDKVLVVRHEPEISETTNVSLHSEFAERRATQVVDGRELTGWFTHDFTWKELQTLTCRERLADLRPGSAAYDGQESMLTLPQVLAMLAGTGVALIIEIKHASYYRDRNLPLAKFVKRDLAAATALPEKIIFESFEKRPLKTLRRMKRLEDRVYLMEAGRAADEPAPGKTYLEELSDAQKLTKFSGISLSAELLTQGAAAKAMELRVPIWVWTLRPENAFLPEAYRSSDDPAQWGRWRDYWRLLYAFNPHGVFRRPSRSCR
jgi:glycerophosphoryl diester phosphodiesterase